MTLLPGWLFMALLAWLASLASELVVLGGKHPLEASALVVVLGLLLRNSTALPAILWPGIKASEKLLAFGIVLMGAALNYNSMLSQGWRILAIIMTVMVVSFIVIYALGKAARLSPSLSMLLAVGTTICGGTAVAITAPLIKAKEEETSYAVATIALWGIIAILLYPVIGRMLQVDDFTFGLFAGTAIHSTPQVVGAGFIYSELSGKTATAVKLVRNCFMAPLAIGIAIWAARGTGASRSSLARAFPWFLFGYFLMSWLNTQQFLTPDVVDGCTASGKFLIVIGMAGVGLNTALSSIRSVGVTPLLVGMGGAIVVAAVSAAAIIAGAPA